MPAKRMSDEDGCGLGRPNDRADSRRVFPFTIKTGEIGSASATSSRRTRSFMWRKFLTRLKIYASCNRAVDGLVAKIFSKLILTSSEGSLYTFDSHVCISPVGTRFLSWKGEEDAQVFMACGPDRGIGVRGGGARAAVVSDHQHYAEFHQQQSDGLSQPKRAHRWLVSSQFQLSLVAAVVFAVADEYDQQYDAVGHEQLPNAGTDAGDRAVLFPPVPDVSRQFHRPVINLMPLAAESAAASGSFLSTTE